MMGLRAQFSVWPLTAIAVLGAALAVQACSGKVDEPSGCATASCGGASGGKAEGGNGAVAGSAAHGGGGAGALNSCEDGIKDGDEADVDCGGDSTCARCTANAKCTANDDCESQYCKSGRCTAASCTDKVQNQDETGVDCGGACLPCDIGQPCEANQDCAGESCVDGTCGDHCTSGAREADETDVDCGGSCGPCASYKSCQEGADCESSICTHLKCAVATCSDGIKNQDESDVDCGGVCSDTKPCAVSSRCNTAADCSSYLCSGAGKCVPDIVLAAEDMIDDFEDKDLLLPVPARGGRAGTWYKFNDGTGTDSLNVFEIKRGGTSVTGIRSMGKDFANWGAGFGIDFNNPTGGADSKTAYDASTYTGVTFWARAEGTLTLTVALPDVDTDAAGSVCTVCSHHYFKTVAVTTTWQRFTVSFSDLTLEPGGIPIATVFKPNALFSAQFRVSGGANYDVSVDDFAFVK
jgi:hypothetical protein